MSLAGKVAVVTGAGRGIGRVMALALAKEGASIVAVARSPKGIEETVRLALESGAPKALALPADVTEEGDVQSLAWQVGDTFGRADILVNHVGGGIHFLSQYDPSMRAWAVRSSGPPFWELPVKWFDDVLRLNLRSTFLCSQALARRFFVPQKSGSIINSTSIQGAMAFPYFGSSPYGAAKAGLNHLTRIMAQELKSYNAAVNAMFVPLIPAGATEGTYWEKVRDQVGGWYKPEVVLPLLIHLAQQNAQGTTGQLVDCLEWIEKQGLGPVDNWKLP